VEGIYKNGKVELLEHLKDVQEARVLITFLESGNDRNGSEPSPAELKGKGPMMRLGMFSGPIQSTEEDFKAAEFHGDPDDGLDWSGHGC
jgi:hypothetical protein